MEYTVRKAEPGDLPEIRRLYASARAFMAQAGNPTQWGSTYPEENILQGDLTGGNLYVLENDTGLHGVFMFRIWEDPTYSIIEGSWHSQGPYGVIHRVAADGSGGILREAVAFAGKQIDCLRIDTHRDNLPMQRAVSKLGFSLCGTIYTEKGSPRLAYDRCGKIV